MQYSDPYTALKEVSRKEWRQEKQLESETEIR